MIRRTAVVLITLLGSSAAQSNYFMYQNWSALNEDSRIAYLAGAFDSLLVFMPDVGDHYETCLARAKMQTSQLTAHVLSYAKDKPALQTGSVQNALVRYLLAVCGKPSK
jgi:hypothetical protein